jgi:hypothetical protein
MRARSFATAAAALSVLAAAAQGPAQVPQPSPELRKLCEALPTTPAEGREMARRAECVLSGVLPSANRLDETRTLARGAMKAGDPVGGLMLYLAYLADPRNQYLRDGAIDAQAYQRIAARSMEERKEQIEAIEGLGFAAGKNHPGAVLLLAGYFHETVAPRNVDRVGALTDVLVKMGARAPVYERFGREADLVAKAGPTKASLGAFFAAYRQAQEVVRSAYAAQSQGKTCDKPELKTVSSGDLEGAQYLPLEGPLVKDSFLVKGQWAEYWSFAACGTELPVKVAFAADGAGGATSDVRFNKGD